MSKNTFVLAAIFIGAALLTFLITRSGCNSSFRPLEEAQSSEEHAHEHQDEQDGKIANLLKEAHDIMYNQTGPPMQGIAKYKEVLALDSNNIEAIYNLGVLSIRTNQLEKAKDRFKKLILLQPENQEYVDTYQDILDKLGEQ